MDRRGPEWPWPRSKCPSGHRYEQSRGTPQKQLWQGWCHRPSALRPFQSDFKLKSCSEAQRLPQVADFLKNRLPQAPSQGRLLPVTPSYQGRMIGNLCQRGAWLQMTALGFSRPCAAWGSRSTVSKPFPVPPPLPSSWQSLEF